MKCILLVAGHATRLEMEVKSDASGEFEHLVGVPKALLPGPDGRRLLDLWWEALSTTRQHFTDIFLVTNGEKYKHYERWATGTGFPRENIINDGTTSRTGGIGAVADFDLVVRSRNIDEDVMVVAGDMLFKPESFDMDGVIRFFNTKGGELSCYYDLLPEEDISTRGILQVDRDSRVTGFWEKPKDGSTPSRKASVVFYCFRKESLPLLRKYLTEDPTRCRLSFGTYIAWLSQQTPVFGMKLPDHFRLIGNVGLSEYRAACLGSKDLQGADRKVRAPIVKRAYARIGIMGNPSDGFFGKTISASISNYWAEVTICESDRLKLERHPLNDPTEFGSLADLHGISRQEGYQGGLRLMQATCKRFYEYCTSRGIAISRRNFSLKYDTNIPRQVGLAGSSAIVTATIQCLFAFFNVTCEDIPLVEQPNLVLTVEKDELGINAGLQDRVIQTYGGLVYMDFSRHLMETQKYGNYVRMDITKLPKFWLAYLADPSDSGKIHSDVRTRFDNGDQEVIQAMQQFGKFADEAKTAIEEQDVARLADLMDSNFNLRRKIYGDAVIGKANLRMIEIARKHNSAAKFPGSGGAIVGLCRDPSATAALKEELEANGFVFVDVILNPHGPNDE